MSEEKQVDESWKDAAAQEKDILIGEKEATGGQAGEEAGGIEVNFLNYVTSLGFQAMIFLGVIPSPVSNETEKNLPQAKFLIDTLIMMRDKTKGNLTEQEDNMLNASIYELQMKYVEVLQAEQPGKEAA